MVFGDAPFSETYIETMIIYLEYWLVVFRPSPLKNDVRQLG